MGSNHPLANRINIGDVLEWKLHWLVCNLDRIKDQINTIDAAQSDAALYNELLAKFSAITESYSRLMWEVKTMLGFDYESDIYPLFDSLEKHSVYIAGITETKALLVRIAEKAADSLREQWVRRIPQ